jgi:uncharacterized membrane-anchored protein
MRRQFATLVAIGCTALAVGSASAVAAVYTAFAAATPDGCADSDFGSDCSKSGWLVLIPAGFLVLCVAGFILCVFVFGQLFALRAVERAKGTP